MKSLKYVTIAAILISFFSVGEVSAKKKMLPKAYMFGFSAAFTDSVVYLSVKELLRPTEEYAGKNMRGILRTKEKGCGEKTDKIEKQIYRQSQDSV